MKKLSIPLATATLVLLSGAPLIGQMTGTSHPEELDDTQAAPPVETSHYVPPSHATGVTAATPAPVQPAPVLYYRSSSSAAAPVQTARATAVDPTLAVTTDVNSGVVVDMPPVGPNELPIGATLKATLQRPISTATTVAGTRFTAALSTDVSRNGVVLLPAGSLVYGRITHIHGGHAIGGPAAIRLHPDSVGLPDGTTYTLHADVTDLDDYATSHVNPEGSIVGNTHPKETAAAVGLTTTSALVAGAVIGGGVGAVVGLGVGAGAATIWWLRKDRQQELPVGTEIVFTLNTPLQLNPASH